MVNCILAVDCVAVFHATQNAKKDLKFHLNLIKLPAPGKRKCSLGQSKRFELPFNGHRIVWFCSRAFHDWIIAFDRRVSASARIFYRPWTIGATYRARRKTLYSDAWKRPIIEEYRFRKCPWQGRNFSCCLLHCVGETCPAFDKLSTFSSHTSCAKATHTITIRCKKDFETYTTN